MKLLPITLAISVLAMSASASAQVNLLRNGSFEDNQISSSVPWQFYEEGSTAIPGWKVVGGQTQLTRTEFVAASHGKQWIDLTGYYGYNKGMQQGFATEVGKSYTVSFDIGSYHNFGNATLALNVGGWKTNLFTNMYNSGVIDWERKSYTFSADSAFTTLTFYGVANGSLSNDGVIGLDNVTVFSNSVPVFAPVPEAETYAMMLAGLGGLGFLARRKKQEQKIA